MSDLVTSAEQSPALGAPASARSTALFGVIVFLASDVMLFAPFFAAYFLLRANNQPWPPEGVELDVPRALAATLVLVASSFTLAASDRAGERDGGERAMRRWLLVTIALGAMFLANQSAEYANARLRRRRRPVRLDLLAAHRPPRRPRHGRAGGDGAAVRPRRAQPHAGQPLPTWAGGVSLFWHLVDLIWIFVFTTIWVMQ